MIRSFTATSLRERDATGLLSKKPRENVATPRDSVALSREVGAVSREVGAKPREFASMFR